MSDRLAYRADLRMLLEHTRQHRPDALPALRALSATIQHARPGLKQNAVAALAQAYDLPFPTPPSSMPSAAQVDKLRLRAAAWADHLSLTDHLPERDAQTFSEAAGAVLAAQISSFVIQHGIDPKAPVPTTEGAVSHPTGDAVSHPADQEFERTLPHGKPLSKGAANPSQMDPELRGVCRTEAAPAATPLKPAPFKAFNAVSSAENQVVLAGGVLDTPPPDAYDEAVSNSPTPSASTPAKRHPSAPSCDPALSDAGALRAPPSSQARQHVARDTTSLTASDVEHVRLAILAAAARQSPLNASIMVRLDKTIAYRSPPVPKAPKGKGKQRSNARKRTAAQSRLVAARKAAVQALSNKLRNLPRTLGFPLSRVAIFECPQAGGPGLHVHILLHLPHHRRDAAQIILDALATLFPNGKAVLERYRTDALAYLKDREAHQLPLDLRGVQSFIRHPNSDMMDEDRAWCAASYLCKSAAQDTPALIGGEWGPIQNHRPAEDHDTEEERSRQNVRAYQPQVSDMGVPRFTTSTDLTLRALATIGFTPDDQPNAAWLLKSERNRRGANPTTRRYQTTKYTPATDPETQGEPVTGIANSFGICYNNTNSEAYP